MTSCSRAQISKSVDFCANDMRDYDNTLAHARGYIDLIYTIQEMMLSASIYIP